MFTALGILFLGILLGRIARNLLSRPLLSRLTMASIFLLLFLLGVAIGANHELLASLPKIGLQSLGIMLCCVVGSIIVSAVITPVITGKKGQFKNKC